jgi:hypothetical protein
VLPFLGQKPWFQKKKPLFQLNSIKEAFSYFFLLLVLVIVVGPSLFQGTQLLFIIMFPEAGGNSLTKS